MSAQVLTVTVLNKEPYVGRCAGKSASSTGGAQWAAERAAAKVMGCGEMEVEVKKVREAGIGERLEFLARRKTL